ncbi:MAG: nucleotidyltransferase substrate binding protein [Clostridiales bacterium]|jgi:nucleotidyltransferase substrate binding protein (TIGR01987 family)|nr:nucleotidyltransferase substrate binding protein [Clostridiales bacterium]
MDNNQDIRWKQRFANFDRAFVLLRSAFEGREVASFNNLEQEGLIQRFEYTFELAWKTIKDYLIESGQNLIEVTPRNVIKEAFEAKIIDNGQAFIDMLLARNLMSHCYDFTKFEEILRSVKIEYLPALEALHDFFIERIYYNG